eukprot:1554701-Prymnesium_polylepis.1
MSEPSAINGCHAFGNLRDYPREARCGCTMAVVIMAQPGHAAAARAAPAALCVSKRAGCSSD